MPRCPSARPSSPTSVASAAIALPPNSAHTRTSRPGRAARTVVSSMSTQTIACLPSAVSTVAACRHRISGCDGTTKPAV